MAVWTRLSPLRLNPQASRFTNFLAFLIVAAAAVAVQKLTLILELRVWTMKLGRREARLESIRNL